VIEHVRRLLGEACLVAGDGGDRRLDRLLAEFLGRALDPRASSRAV